MLVETNTQFVQLLHIFVFSLKKFLDLLLIMQFDELLKILGELGRYQKIRLFLICLVSIVCAFHAMNMVFVGAKPDYQCKVKGVNFSDAGLNDVTQEDWNKLIRSADKKSCSMFDEDEAWSLITNGNSTFAALQNVSLTKTECTSWDYSEDVYGPTIVSEVYKLLSTNNRLVCKLKDK